MFLCTAAAALARTDTTGELIGLQNGTKTVHEEWIVVCRRASATEGTKYVDVVGAVVVRAITEQEKKKNEKGGCGGVIATRNKERPRNRCSSYSFVV